MTSPDVVVCSFYTDDDYYRQHAENLRRRLGELGLAHELAEVAKAPGQDWADLCRQKIPFLAEVCERYPTSRVFWIDVDCSLLSLPTPVAGFTADLIGFQRGFSSPLTLGYGQRTRFWEPCFLGVNTTAVARAFVRDAARLEADSPVRATDDYFFEESWRANAADLSFQIIPSPAALGRGEGSGRVPPFFVFGASGNVEAFKGRVAQHDEPAGAPASRRPAGRGRLLRGAKAIERRLPTGLAGPLRRAADRSGITHALTAGMRTPSGDPVRARLVRELLAAGQRGEVDAVASTFERLAGLGVVTTAEWSAKRAADAFAHYAAAGVETIGGHDPAPLPLAWWPRPLPGNFGDWLSPLVLAGVSGRPVTYVPPTARSAGPHLVSVGSIGRFVKPDSTVVGTGVSSTDLQLEPRARYVSVRGPITAELLRSSGGPAVESFGDPGLLLSRLLPLERSAPSGRLVLVRHVTHAALPLLLPEDIDELSVARSHPDDVADLVRGLLGADGVITSAMHVLIACHSYGIPCALVTFEGFEHTVHGTGVKYRDYSLGAGLERVHEPVPVPLDLRRVDLRGLLATERVSEAKLDEIEAALAAGIAAYEESLPAITAVHR